MEDANMNLSEAVKAYRKEHRYSLREFADLCGLSHVQIYRIETGKKDNGQPFEPKVDTLKKLAAGMGISFDEIMKYCDDLVVVWGKDGMDAKRSERQDVIDKVILATPEQFSLIKSYVDFVTKS